MKNTYITTACCLLAALCIPTAPAQEVQTFVEPTAAPAAEKPIIAVPLFTNRTKSDSANGTKALPEEAKEIATDAATSAVANTRRFRVLSRSTPTLKTVDSEILFQGTSGSLEATQMFSSLKSCNAKYLLLGRLNQYRFDTTEGYAYGVKRKMIVTTISVDMQLIDVNTMEIIAGETAQEQFSMRIPEGTTTITSIHNWEPVLRKAVSNCVPKFLNRIIVSSSAPDEVEGAEATIPVNINSVPEGADVEFNGNFMGNTPCSIELPSSVGVLSISAPGYETWHKKIRPAANMNIAPKLKEQKTNTVPTPVPAVEAKPTPSNKTKQAAGDNIFINIKKP